ncbi:MAG: hypothetical protein GVY29_11565 [Spirochaetes bacterium]|jgi:hypothetical protein|nr:hypothetical protein [Spirochaetota bacterium]
MKIQLNRYALDRNLYFRILLRSYVSRRWWTLLLGFVLLLFFVFVLIRAPQALTLIHYVAVAILVGLPGLYVLRFYRFAFKGDNEPFFEERGATLDDEGLSIHFDDGTTDTVPWDQVLRVRNTAEYLLVYVTRRQFVFIPKAAFPSVDDLNTFLSFAQAHGWLGRGGRAGYAS